MAGCPDDTTLQAFLEGYLDPRSAQALHEHIDSCSACSELVLCTAGQDQDPRDDPAALTTVATAQQPGPAPPTLTFAVDEIVASRYRIVRFLAQGGMGQVYLTRDLELDVEVALKAIVPRISNDPRSLSRFKREVLLTRRVSHPNVCRIFDLGLHQQSGPAGQQQTIHFLTMEFLAGHTLAQRLRRRGPMEPAEALPLLRQMCLALDAAHQQGIVHRDFKPDNVFLVPGGTAGDRIVVTDFGLARASVAQESIPPALGGGAPGGLAGPSRELRQECVESSLSGGTLVGTPAYMAPEQVAGDEVGPAADVYALGSVLFEMVTGERPFGAGSALGVAVKRLHEAPPSPRSHRLDLDARWEAAILRCLERAPAARFQRATDVALALEGPAPLEVVDEVPQQRGPLIAVLAAVVALLGASVLLIRHPPWQPTTVAGVQRPGPEAPDAAVARREFDAATEAYSQVPPEPSHGALLKAEPDRALAHAAAPRQGHAQAARSEGRPPPTAPQRQRSVPTPTPPLAASPPDAGAPPDPPPPPVAPVTLAAAPPKIAEEDGPTLLHQAQGQLTTGHEQDAIELARPLTALAGTRRAAWLIIGTAACQLPDLGLVREAYQQLDSAKRSFLQGVCARHSVFPAGGNEFSFVP